MTSLQREINILQEPTSDRTSKKTALEKILSITIKTPPDQLLLLFQQISKPILKSLLDPIEKCRDVSVDILLSYLLLIRILKRSQDLSLDIAVLIIPVLVQQLSQPQIIEPSEEIRLNLVKMLRLLITKMREKFVPFVNDAIKIVTRTLLDSYQEIKKESCLVVIELCQVVPRGIPGNICKSILGCVKHKHSSVRVVGLRALAKTILVDASSIEDVFDQIKDLERDKSPLVREQLYTFARDLQVDLMDRHVYAHRILPILYSGLKDEMPKLVTMTKKFLDEAGERYESDNHDRIKDEMDYSDGHDRIDRPRVGSRHLARDNTQKIVNKQVELLSDWNADTRLKAVQVLTVFLDFVENHITGYTNVILPAVYKVLAGDEVVVMNETKKLMSKLGEYVHPDTTLSLMLPALKTGGGGLSTFRLGCLRALHGVLEGSAPEMITPLLFNLLQELSDRDLVTSENCFVLLELSKCLLAVTDKLSNSRDVLVMFFYLTVQLKSIPGNEKVAGYADMQNVIDIVLDKLAVFMGVTIQDLYCGFLGDAISALSINYEHWTQYSIEPRVLETILLESGDGYIDFFEQLVPIFKACAVPEKDLTLKEMMISLALKLFKRTTSLNVQKLNTVLFTEFLKNVVLKNCIWKAGRKALQLRAVAVQLLYSLLSHFKGHDNIKQIVSELFDNDILPVVLTNLDDDEMITRQHCLYILNELLEWGLFKGIIFVYVAETFKKVYPELLKRMDDAKDEIRVITGNSWCCFSRAVGVWRSEMETVKQNLPEEDRHCCAVVLPGTTQVLEIDIEQGHFETILDCLFIHLDDVNVQVQEATCQAIQSLKAITGDDMIKERIQVARNKHRSTQFLDRLL